MHRIRWSMMGVLILFLAGVISAAGTNEWPHWRGPTYNGISPETAWRLDGAKIAWRAQVGSGFSSVSIAGGKLYTMGNTGFKKSRPSDKDVVTCLNAVTGKELWTFSYPQPLEPKYYEGGTSATPTVGGGRVYTLSKSGDAYCLNATTGAEIWGKNIAREIGAKVPTWGFSGSPVLWKNLVILNVGSNGVALEAKTGKVVWTTGKNAAGYATPVPFTLGGKTLLAVFSLKTLAAVEPDTGRVIWEYPWKTRYDVNAADPVIRGDEVFISSGYNHGCSLLRMTLQGATRVWENRKMRNHFNSCVLWKGYIYGFDESTFKCLDWATGTEKWAKNGLGKGSLMLSADGRLIILSEKGQLVSAPADPGGFRPLGQMQVLRGKCWTVPVLCNGMIYARNYKGDLVAVDVTP